MSTENTITTAEKDFAAAPNATLDELVGTTTNTALLPEPAPWCLPCWRR